MIEIQKSVNAKGTEACFRVFGYGVDVCAIDGQPVTNHVIVDRLDTCLIKNCNTPEALQITSLRTDGNGIACIRLHYENSTESGPTIAFVGEGPATKALESCNPALLKSLKAQVNGTGSIALTYADCKCPSWFELEFTVKLSREGNNYV